MSDGEDLSGIPKELISLMATNKVTAEDIRFVVSQQGYYPFETRIQDYDKEFIEGCLIAAWPQVYSKILCNQDIPFE